MELSSFEVKSASAGDLKAMISMCEQELKNRSAARRDELIQMICDAMNTLHKEFPMVELRMGYQCSECTMDELDLSSFDTSNVTNMSHMFAGDSIENFMLYEVEMQLTTIYVNPNKWDISQVENTTEMFDQCWADIVEKS